MCPLDLHSFLLSFLSQAFLEARRCITCLLWDLRNPSTGVFWSRIFWTQGLLLIHNRDFSAFVHNFVYKMLSHIDHVSYLWKIWTCLQGWLQRLNLQELVILQINGQKAIYTLGTLKFLALVTRLWLTNKVLGLAKWHSSNLVLIFNLPF